VVLERAADAVEHAEQIPETHALDRAEADADLFSSRAQSIILVVWSVGA
jgi:hypothetical protein